VKNEIRDSVQLWKLCIDKGDPAQRVSDPSQAARDPTQLWRLPIKYSVVPSASASPYSIRIFLFVGILCVCAPVEACNTIDNHNVTLDTHRDAKDGTKLTSAAINVYPTPKKGTNQPLGRVQAKKAAIQGWDRVASGRGFTGNSPLLAPGTSVQHNSGSLPPNDHLARWAGLFHLVMDALMLMCTCIDQQNVAFSRSFLTYCVNYCT
jgi:hypothetical protein